MARTHTPIVEGLGLESALESANYSYETADSNADPPEIGVWVWAFSVQIHNSYTQKHTVIMHSSYTYSYRTYHMPSNLSMHNMSAL